MARCPFVIWVPNNGTGGNSWTVHRAAERSSAECAFAEFTSNRSDPRIAGLLDRLALAFDAADADAIGDQTIVDPNLWPARLE